MYTFCRPPLSVASVLLSLLRAVHILSFMTTKNIYSRVRDHLEPGELEHLEKVAEWLGRPHYAVIVDEVRRQYGRNPIDGEYKINKVTSLDGMLIDEDTPIQFSDNSIPLLDSLAIKEKMKYLDSKIDLLEDEEKNALRAWLNGTSYRAIAKSIRCPLTQVDNIIRRAKRKLADTLIPSYFLSA